MVMNAMKMEVREFFLAPPRCPPAPPCSVMDLLCFLSLQHTIRAPKSGVIKRVFFSEGSQANRHAPLVELEEEEAAQREGSSQ